MSELEMLKLKVQFLEARLNKINAVASHEKVNYSSAHCLASCLELCKYLSKSSVLESDFRLVQIMLDHGEDIKIIDIDIDKYFDDLYVH